MVFHTNSDKDDIDRNMAQDFTKEVMIHIQEDDNHPTLDITQGFQARVVSHCTLHHGAVSPSSASSGRDFSYIKYLINQKRSPLANALISDLSFLRSAMPGNARI